MSSFVGLSETIEAYGVPGALTPTAVRTTSIRPKPARKSTKRIPRRLAAPWDSWVFTFHPTRPRRGGGWNVCSVL